MIRVVGRRLSLSAAVIVTVAVVAFAGVRLSRQDIYGPDPVGGTIDDLDRLFLHFNHEAIWLVRDGWEADVTLIALAFVFGVGAGVLGGIWCAQRPRSLVTRAVEWIAMILLCAPVYVVGLGLLLLFEPTFGKLPLPVFFEAHRYVPPDEDFGRFATSLIVPALVLGAPLAGGVLRLTQAMILENLHEDYIRTGRAKGLTERMVLRRHAAPTSYPSIASLVAASVPAVITNAVFVEIVFAVQGTFRHTREALGQTPGSEGGAQYGVMQMLGIWAAVLTVVFGLLADIALSRADPRTSRSR